MLVFFTAGACAETERNPVVPQNIATLPQLVYYTSIASKTTRDSPIKHHSPRSQGLEMPAGALHWLPTELPPGVRFIVSTIATSDKAGAPPKPHRTYLELVRR